MVSESLYNVLDINIDRHLSPYLPRNLARHLPKHASHFLGYRSTPSKEPPALIQWTLTLFATLAGICLVGGIFNYAPSIQKWNPPTVFASLGASAVLDYNAVRSPLAQPRNAVVGHTLAAIVGVGISKAFQLDSGFFENYDWVVGAVACACASLAMSVTRTVHPPGGATAVLACTEKQIAELGWIFPPLILLASVLMTTIACIFNNTLRQYPVYWWTPEDVGQKLPLRLRWRRSSEAKDIEEAGDLKNIETNTSTNSEHTLTHDQSSEVEFLDGLDQVFFSPHKIQTPSYLTLSDEEMGVLQRLQERLRRARK